MKRKSGYSNNDRPIKRSKKYFEDLYPNGVPLNILKQRLVSDDNITKLYNEIKLRKYIFRHLDDDCRIMMRGLMLGKRTDLYHEVDLMIEDEMDEDSINEYINEYLFINVFMEQYT